MPSLKSERADIIREMYIKAKRREGLMLSDARGAWAQYGSYPVVLPYANELRHDRWLHHVQATLLGPNTPYVVLLCERTDGSILDIVIPPGRARAILRKSTRVRRGIKINVHKPDEHTYILITGEGRIDVSSMVGNWKESRRNSKKLEAAS